VTNLQILVGRCRYQAEQATVGPRAASVRPSLPRPRPIWALASGSAGEGLSRSWLMGQATSNSGKCRGDACGGAKAGKPRKIKEKIKGSDSLIGRKLLGVTTDRGI